MAAERSPRRDFERDIEDVRRTHEDLVRGAGGTPGGTWLFFWGLALSAAGGSSPCPPACFPVFWSEACSAAARR
ncbi:MAG: hypothetical protein EBZ59_03815 [Planctomycetia bacterium]|nr:hypothetical protein [Planctomycetia bacterium]